MVLLRLHLILRIILVLITAANVAGSKVSSVMATLVVALLCFPFGVRAEAPVSPPAPAIVPPSPLAVAEAAYPPDALATRETVEVVLELTLDATGAVSEAEVRGTPLPSFARAAREAALRSRFHPATQDGEPIACRIEFTYRFSAPVVEGRLEGRITLSTAAPAVGARVLVSAGRELRTGPDGTFVLESLAPGRYEVEVIAEGHAPARSTVEVTAGHTTELTLTLAANEATRSVEPTFQTTVRSSAAETLRQSAQAVKVVEIEQARQRSSDLGEVLARTEGVGVQRGGGLGSGTRFSLNGLTDDQVRILLDGVPLEFAGLPFGIASVPVNLVERVEIYRGVVPVRFGSDALGGAVNLVTDRATRGTHAAASYQVGSFGTHRLSLSARHLFDSGFFVRADGYLDRAQNDYKVDVQVPDARGKLAPARVSRFHDGYAATGARAELGFVNRPWAKRFALQGFFGESEKELQHNPVMTIPYGEATYGRTAAGAMLRYEHKPVDALAIDVAGGWSYGATTFLDVSSCVYDWYGTCVRQRLQPGETTADNRAHDQMIWQHAAFMRANAAWALSKAHTLRLGLAPTFVTRTGEERRTPAGERDPMSAVRDLTTFVSGLEYEAKLRGGTLENVVFGKWYRQGAHSVERLPDGSALDEGRTTSRFGVGDALRYRLFEGIDAKLSYEWATRLPRADEIFGDGGLQGANLELRPESSHNVNLGVSVRKELAPAGAVRGEVSGFLRDASDLIVLLGDEVFSYQNVSSARSTGIEASAGWTSPGRYFWLDGNATWQDFRNTSSDGAFATFAGDPIPNRPYLFANASARVRVPGLGTQLGELNVLWNMRWVHEFYRGWASRGLKSSKQIVPSQQTHAVALTYVLDTKPVGFTFSAEVQNLFDAQVYDFFGAQRPGRAFFFKTTASL
jgi:TonB family protein